MASTPSTSLMKARTDYKALLFDKQTQEELKEQLEKAVKDADKSKKAADALVREAKSNVDDMMEALKDVSKKRSESQDKLDDVEEQIEKLEAAHERATAEEKKGKKPRPSSKQLTGTLDKLKAERAKAVAEVEGYTNEVEITRDVLANLQTELNELLKTRRDANADLRRAKKAVSDNASEIKVLSTKLVAAKTSVDGLSIDTVKLKPEWDKVRQKFAWHSPPVYLHLKKQQRDIDPIAESIFLAMKKKYNSDERLEALKKLIQENGIATECMKLTARWNKKIYTMPYAAVCVLDSTYYTSLCKVIESAGPDVQTAFDDTVGLLESVRLEQQDESGPIKEFALAVVEQVAKIKQWQLPEGAMDLIASRIHQSLLYR